MLEFDKIKNYKHNPAPGGSFPGYAGVLACGYRQRLAAKPRRSVAFAQHGQAAVFAAQFVGKGEEVLQDWILHIGLLISWPPVTLKAMPVM